MEVFDVQTIEGSTDQLITCRRCKHSFVVGETWPGGLQFATRTCPWCSTASYLPGHGTVLYDGHSTASLEKDEAELLVGMKRIRYSPEDGPGGNMYRPVADEKGMYKFTTAEAVSVLIREIPVYPSPTDDRVGKRIAEQNGRSPAKRKTTQRSKKRRTVKR